MQQILRAVPIYIQFQDELRARGVTSCAMDLLFEIEKIVGAAVDPDTLDERLERLHDVAYEPPRPTRLVLHSEADWHSEPLDALKVI